MKFLILTLDNFRCWDHLELKFPLNEITLIKGHSGLGKTTIFQALVWLLYGNIRLVYPNTNEKAKTKVKLELPNLLIERYRNPNRLLLYHYDKLYEDKIAQAFIDDLYGKYDLWLASCYIGQNTRNAFLTAPNSGKMELLNMIAFNEEDPTIYLNKIDHLLHEKENNYKVKFALYNQHLQELNSQLPLLNQSFNLPELKTKLEAIIQLIPIKEQNLITYNSKLKLITELEKQLSTLTTTEPIAPNNTNELTILNELLPLIQQLTILTTELNKYRLSTPFIELNYTLKDYEFSLTQENNYYQYERLCQQFNIKYSKSEIENKIKVLNNLLEKQPLIEKYQQQLTLQTQIKQYQGQLSQLQQSIMPEPNITLPAVNILQEEKLTLLREKDVINKNINQLLQGSNVHKCPDCQTNLQLINNVLCKASIEPVNNNLLQEYKNQLIGIDKQIQQIELNIKLRQEQENKSYQYKLWVEKNNLQQEQIKQILSELNSKIEIVEPINDRLLSVNEVKILHQQISQLKTIEYYQLPTISSYQIKNYLQQKEAHYKYVEIEAQIKQLEGKIPLEYRDLKLVNERINCLRREKEIYERELIKYREQQELRKRFKREIEETRENLGVDEMESLEQLRREKKECEEQIRRGEESEKIRIFYGEVMKEREEVVKLTEEIKNLQVFRQCAVDMECKILQDIVEHINGNINEICQNLFDKDINIELNLFKQNKTTGNMKANVNFVINYVGGTYDNINQLSGGEGDRASLALTLALNKLSGCPLLLLDETFASLDSNMKELALKTIRENSSNTILVILHDGVEGLFDEVIDLEECCKN